MIEASHEYGQRLYESVMENARSKVVFSLSLRDRNLAPLADWLYSGTFDPNRIKLELYSHKVMDYAEETREITIRGTSRGTGRSEARGETAGTGSDHRTYVSLETLAFAIHRVLQDETDVLVEHLSALAAGKRE